MLFAISCGDEEGGQREKPPGSPDVDIPGDEPPGDEPPGDEPPGGGSNDPDDGETLPLKEFLSSCSWGKESCMFACDTEGGTLELCERDCDKACELAATPIIKRKSGSFTPFPETPRPIPKTSSSSNTRETSEARESSESSSSTRRRMDP